MKNLRIGVVGVGHIGSNHARLYAEIPSAEFTAVYDIDPITNRTIATKFGAAPAKSLDEFIGMVDAASVATPTNTHYTIARAQPERRHRQRAIAFRRRLRGKCDREPHQSRADAQDSHFSGRRVPLARLSKSKRRNLSAGWKTDLARQSQR